MKKKPVIGITGAYVEHTRHMKGVYVHQDYHQAVLAAGGIPIILPFNDSGNENAYIDLLDGIIFSGGEDIDPFFYHEQPHPQLGFVTPKRDAFELSLLKESLARELPILGICRGLQLINVAFGGTLIQDIPSVMERPIKHAQIIDRQEVVHEVLLEKESYLHNLWQLERLRVNSLHHQAIKKLGTGLSVAATSPADGIIEAIEHKDYPYLHALQWHPESMAVHCSFMQTLFADFITVASN